MARTARSLLAAALLLCAMRCAAQADASQPDTTKVQQEYEAGYAAATSGDYAGAQTHFRAVLQLAPQLAEAHNALGSVLLAQGDAKAAVPEFQAALALKPLESAGENLAIAYARLGERDKAARQFAVAAQRNALSPRAALLYAPMLVADGKLEDAATMLRRAIDQTPSEAAGASAGVRAQLAALHDAYGSVLAQQRHWDEAQQQFLVAVQLDAASTAHFHLGALYLDQQQPDAALRELNTAVGIAPEDAAVLAMLARAQTAMQQDTDSLATLRKAEKALAGKEASTPLRIQVDYQLALALQNTASPGDSIPYFQKVLAAQPENTGALSNYALALVQTGRAKESLPYYERALKVAPHDSVVRMGYGAAYLQQNELVDAEKQFRAAIVDAPDSAELHYDLGLALKLRDQLPPAEEELKRAIALDASLVDPHITLGTLYMQQGKFDDAAAEMQSVLAVQPDNGSMWAMLGSTLKQAGKLPQAVDALRRAIALQPDQPGPHITLSGILQAQGDTEQAAAERKIAGQLTRGAMNTQAAMFATNAGDLLLSKGQLDDAMAQYRKAIQDDASYKPAHRQLAVALEQKGRHAEAETEKRLGVDKPAAAEN